jgi:hypothetical protein
LRRQWPRSCYHLPQCLLLVAQRPSLRELGPQDVALPQRALEQVCWARLLRAQEARVWMLVPERALGVRALAQGLGPVVWAMVRVTELELL